MTAARAAGLALVVLFMAADVAPQTVPKPLAVDVSVRAVSVDVLVTRDDRAVTTLTAADFTVRDNGVEQRIDVARLDQMPMTLLLVLDTSASVRGDTLSGLKAAAQAAAAALRPDDSVGVVTFADRVEMRLAPTRDLERLVATLAATTGAGETRLYDAVQAAMEQRRRGSGRILILVFSDGADTVSWTDPRTVIAAAQRTDAVVHVVSTEPPERVTPRDFTQRQRLLETFETEPLLFGRVFLGRLAEQTGGQVLSSQAAGFGPAFVHIVEEYRSRYMLSYQPTGVDASGWHAIDVDVKGRGLRVRARPGYLR